MFVSELGSTCKLMEISAKVVLSLSFILALFSFSVFLQGFMPAKSGLPGFAKKRAENVTIPSYSRLVIIVIDALRKDFMYGDVNYMKYTQNLINRRQTVPLVLVLQPPSVTLPRLKGLTTGGIPSFADVVVNFNSQKLTEDNIVDQFKIAGKTLVMFGDETWLNIFPSQFIRADPVSSFYVSDYTEVDYNVSRHLEVELQRTDWDVMILHYLGLDHIGHIAGPESPLIKPKLQEMDRVVEKIHEALKQQVNAGHGDSLMLICGDHGMADQGGHGGATPSEVQTPAVFISTKFDVGKGLPYGAKKTVQQIDVTPTLAFLFGLPIPKNNVGIFIPELFGEVSTVDLVKLYKMNMEQMLDLLEANGASMQDDKWFKVKYEDLQQAASNWILSSDVEVSGNARKQQGQKLVKEFQSLSRRMQDKVSSSLSNFDMYAILFGMITLWMIYLFTSTYIRKNPVISNHLVVTITTSITAVIVLLLSVAFHLTICTGLSKSLVMCGKSPLSLAVQVVCVMTICHIAVLASNCFSTVLGKLQYLKFSPTARENFQKLLAGGTVLHGASLMSSSFVEEEHQTWYFFTMTISILSLWLTVSRAFAKAKFNRLHSPVSDQKSQYCDVQLTASDTVSFKSEQFEYMKTSPESPDNSQTANISLQQRGHLFHGQPSEQGFSTICLSLNKADCKVLACVCLIALLERTARSLNQTGNKWLEQADVGDWLTREENKPILSCAVVLAMLVVTILRMKTHRLLVRIMLPVGMVTVYCFKAVYKVFLIPEFLQCSENGSLHVWEARLVYLIIGCIIIDAFCYPVEVGHSHGKTHVFLENFHTAWILLMMLLLKPHNIILVCMLVMQETLLSQCLMTHIELSVPALTIYYIWMGNAAFFYQGNSNSLSSVDVGSGYVGLTEYQPVLITTLLICSTYAGLLFWLIALLKILFKKRLEHEMTSVVHTLFLCRIFPLAMSATVAFVNRFHLFVWSVFSPKLLYEGLVSVVVTIFCLSIYCIDVLVRPYC